MGRRGGQFPLTPPCSTIVRGSDQAALLLGWWLPTLSPCNVPCYCCQLVGTGSNVSLVRHARPPAQYLDDCFRDPSLACRCGGPYAKAVAIKMLPNSSRFLQSLLHFLYELPSLHWATWPSLPYRFSLIQPLLPPRSTEHLLLLK